MVKRVNGRWILYTKNGKRILGRHTTRAQAEAQEAAININKAKNVK